MLSSTTLLAVLVSLSSILANNGFPNDGSGHAFYPYDDLPATETTNLGPYQPGLSESVVIAKDGKLYLDGQDYSFATFNYPGLIGQDDFKVGEKLYLMASADGQANDTFRTFTAFARPVTRSYTLGVSSINVKNDSAFVQGWDSAADDWVYNEDKFVQFDRTLVQARQWGVRFIVPVINQDYGTEDTNYAGNWADLIKMYYGLDNYNQTKSINFWTDRNLIEATKKLYSKVLTRKNTLNGIIYGQDNTFLAIETGNELNYNMTRGPGIPDSDYRRPPPGAWTAEIAQHLKSLAPNILVADGTLSRANATEDTWAPEALDSPYVDMYSNHYYDVDLIKPMNFYKMSNDSNYVRQHGKTFFVGEHGFYPFTEQWRDFFQLQLTTPTAGSMVWGLRAHNAEGGFDTHGEGNGIYSYHAPGWSPPVEGDFDPREQFIVREIYKLSYDILGQVAPSWPIPNAPTILPVNTTANGTSFFTYQGGSWAEHYEIFHKSSNASAMYAGKWAQVANFVRDNVGPGLANYTIEDGPAGDWAMRGVSVDQVPGDWSEVVTV